MLVYQHWQVTSCHYCARKNLRNVKKMGRFIHRHRADCPLLVPECLEQQKHTNTTTSVMEFVHLFPLQIIYSASSCILLTPAISIYSSMRHTG